MNSLEVFGTIVISAITGLVTLLVAIRTGMVELKKRRPETITHNCRLINIDVYTFIKGEKKQTPPLCPYLDSTDYISCKFDPEYYKEELLMTKAKNMKEINKNKCYIALFNDKYDLI